MHLHGGTRRCRALEELVDHDAIPVPVIRPCRLDNGPAGLAPHDAEAVVEPQRCRPHNHPVQPALSPSSLRPDQELPNGRWTKPTVWGGLGSGTHQGKWRGIAGGEAGKGMVASRLPSRSSGNHTARSGDTNSTRSERGTGTQTRGAVSGFGDEEGGYYEVSTAGLHPPTTGHTQQQRQHESHPAAPAGRR
jgi:hypothetical protein